MSKIIAITVLSVLLLSGFASASTLARLEVLVLSPETKETIYVNLNQEFILNGQIRQKALLRDYHQVYDNLVIQLEKITEQSGRPEADLRISALEWETPVSIGLSNMREGNEENTCGIKIKLLDFVRDGEGYIGAKFLIQREERRWSEIFVEIIRQIIFG